jgi:integrase
MAFVQKRVRASGTTTYVVRWYAANGTERTKGGFRTRKSAAAYARKVEAEALAGNDFDPAKGAVTFRDAAQLWLASRADLKATTLAGHCYALARAADRVGDGATLGIDATFGGYPLNAITREYIQEWVNRLTAAGKKPSTVRHAYFLVRMVLAQAVADGRLASNPADYVKLPTEHSTKGGNPGVVDDPAQFLTAAQVSALVAATPWPYNVLVHVSAWSGLRAAELAGLQVGDVTLPAAPTKPGVLRVERTARALGAEVEYLPPKTKGSFRRVPLTPETTELLRGYLAEHPRANDPTAPLFPGMRLTSPKPTGVRATSPTRQTAKERQAAALAKLSVAEAEARLMLDWDASLRHSTFYKAVFRPAVLRANRLTRDTALPPTLKFHSLRHTYASLCIAAGIKPEKLSQRMGHAKITTTLTVYVHLFPEDDASEDMAALGAMAPPKPKADNVIPLHG